MKWTTLGTTYSDVTLPRWPTGKPSLCSTADVLPSSAALTCTQGSALLNSARGVQTARSLTQLTTRYAHHILSLFNIVTCNWNALGPAFLQRSDTVVEELLFLVFQPAICRAIRTRTANTVGDGVAQSRHFGWQPVLELTCDQMRCPGSKWLLFFFLNWKNSWKDTKISDDKDVHGKGWYGGCMGKAPFPLCITGSGGVAAGKL